MGDNTQQSYAEQISNFASELRDHIDDEAMLEEIHVAIKAMLSGDGVNERDIRDVLQQHHDSGDLRDESFQLVQRLIDNIVSEELSSATDSLPGDDSDPFSSTTVIPTVTLSPGLADQQLQVGSVLRDRFMLTEEIPGGSMGTVYKALDRRLAEADEEKHWVAIKVLSPRLSYDADALRALQQEAVKTRCLSHPNIVRFIDLDRDDILYFIVMEWLEGRSLARILDDSATKQFDIDTALDIIRQIGNALDYAHLRGVIHADVKPGNIMITPSGQAKLFDFGIARIRQKQSKSQHELEPETLKAATPAYSSMQVLTGEEPVAADDVFSLACLAYRLIAGYRVFGPRNAAEAAEAGMNPQRIECLDDSQWQALKKALAYSRVARYSSPAEFVKALTASRRTPVVNIERDSGPADTHIDEFDSKRRRPWRFVALALIFVAAGAVVFEEELLQVLRPYFSEAADSFPTSTSMDTGEPQVEESQGAAESPNLQQETNRSATAVTEPLQEELAADPQADELETLPDRKSELPGGAALIATPQATTVPDEKPTITAEQESDTPAETVAAMAVASQKDTPVARTDFSTLPPANIILPLAGPGDLPGTSSITLLENGNAAIIDFVRDSNIEEALQLKLAEHSYSGNQSPLESGQYHLSNDGLLEFPSGQHRARVSIRMEPDSVREADQQAVLVVVDTEYDDIEFASIRLNLQDDDQRAYENQLPPNTVAFAVGRMSVRERDAAVHVDVIRFKADETEQEVGYIINAESATEGEDYIAPAGDTVFFGPGQRSVRILIPLIQDSTREPDETFTVELLGDLSLSDANTYQQIAVMIRDDDS